MVFVAFTKFGWAWTSKHNKHRQSFERYTHKQQRIGSSTPSPSSHPFVLGSSSPSNFSQASQNQPKTTTVIAFLASHLSSFLGLMMYLQAHGHGNYIEEYEVLGC